MKAAHMKQKIVIPALVGMMMIPGSAVYAADQKAEVYPVLPAAGIETVVTDCYETKVKENSNEKTGRLFKESILSFNEDRAEEKQDPSGGELWRDQRGVKPQVR